MRNAGDLYSVEGVGADVAAIFRASSVGCVAARTPAERGEPLPISAAGENGRDVVVGQGPGVSPA